MNREVPSTVTRGEIDRETYDTILDLVAMGMDSDDATYAIVVAAANIVGIGAQGDVARIERALEMIRTVATEAMVASECRGRA